jgi:hydroxymethylpyrimidine pyrophosphatase-like HAD family hydrolase
MTCGRHCAAEHLSAHIVLDFLVMAEVVRDVGLPGAGPADGPVVADLLADLREVCERLATCVRLGHLLDAFLFAAGAVQIVEDHLQRDPLSLRRSAKYLGGPAAVPLSAAAAAVVGVAGRRPATRRALVWCAEAVAVRDLLADAVVGSRPDEESRRRLGHRTGLLVDGLDALPAGVDEEVLRLPACFRGHGLLPADAVRLAADYAPSVEGREVLVLGVRTSGSYLGPLVAAALRASGSRARAASTRPGQPLLPADARALAEVLAGGGAAAVVDDPPNTGGSLRDSAQLLEAHGAPREGITLLVPLFGEEAPSALAAYRRVELPFRRWAVHALLEPEPVAEVLTSLWGEPVSAVEQVDGQGDDSDGSGGRHHLTRVLRAELGSGRQRRVVVSGAGVGYLGRYSLAVAAAVPQHVATTYGFRDGLVYREWLPGPARVPAARAADAADYARYVADRAAAMPAVRDRAAGLAGREPAWEQASRLLQRGYGRFGVGLRLPLLDPAARRLLRSPRPSVVDGATGLDTWFRVDGALRKVRADDLAFGNLDHACYDAVYDLAGVDPGSADGAFVDALRAAHPSDPERFLLYELVHLQDSFTGWSRDRRASARAVQRYLAGILPTPEPSAGPLCALDIDGVLESLAYGFPVITPTAVLALRALAHHGFRPVPVTGRSLEEVRDRCATLGLAGGVAEYGSVVHDQARGVSVQVVGDADRALLDRLRAALSRAPGTRIDEDYRYSVRAYRTGDGWGPVPAEALEGALASLGEDRRRLRVVPGRYQTDVVAAAVDKGRGLRALVELLGRAEDSAPAVRFAVGDTGSDLPMFAVAEQAWAPANADDAVRGSGVTVLRQAYAAGVDAAVARVLGHRPGGCPACRPARQRAGTRLLLTILDAPRAGRAGLPAATLRLAAELAARRHPGR